MHKLFCPDCGNPVHGDDIHLDTGYARCRPCDFLFSIPARMAAGAGRPDAPEAWSPLPLPPGLRLEEDGATLRFTRHWFEPRLYIFAPAVLIWGTMAAAFLAAGPRGRNATNFFGALLVMLPMALVGAYYVLCGLLNRTTVTVGGDHLTVRHGPVPTLRGGQTVNARDLAQLYVKERVYRTRSGRLYRYALWAVLRDGTRLELLRGLEDLRQARYLEERIERRLNLADRPVAEEFRV